SPLCPGPTCPLCQGSMAPGAGKGACHEEDLSFFSEDEQHLRRRYAESVIASEISKIRDSMLQRNFIDFLLNQKSAAVEEDQEERWYNDLLKLSLHDKQRNI
uniref:Uncharacterized protein n=1 Tax=Amphiprion percula TaxID=161767 RepID=A0A3P8S2M4_AMPPE